MTLERGDSPLAGRRPAPLRSVAGLSSMNSMNSMNSMAGGVGPGHTPVSSSSIGTLGTISSMGAVGSMSGSGTVGTQTTSSGQVPSTASLGQNSSMDGRTSSASFWLELNGVERWFDTLEPHERVTLMASLFARSPERQLQQYSSTIDKALRNQTSTANLSRFGVGQNNQNNDLASVYRYRSPLSAGASTGSVGAGPPSSTATTVSGSSAVVGASGKGDASGARSSSTKAAKTPSSVRAGPSGSGHAASQADQSAAGYVSPLSFTSNASHATDLYSQAFLPLPRTQSYAQGYSPWGTEIRRPNSAAADAWSDKTRNSPTLQSTGNNGSPNISNLSLDTPLPFGSGSSASTSTTSPIGHPLKPWRTFTPHQNPIGSGIGLAPDSGQSQRRNIPHSSPSSPPSTRSPALPAGLAPGSVPLSTTLSSVHVPVSTQSLMSNDDGSSSSNSSSDSAGGRGFTAANNGGSYTSNSNPGSMGSSRSGSTTPKDNRLARRSVNIVDVELLSDIGAWLRSLRLHKYTGNLSGMKWQDVIQLSDQDLEDRGVNALGARRKLLKMFEEIRTAQEAGQLPDE